MSHEQAVAAYAMSVSLQVTVPETLIHVGREAAKPTSGGQYYKPLYVGANPLQQIADSVGRLERHNRYDSRLQQAGGYDPMSRQILEGILGNGPSSSQRPKYEHELYRPNLN